MVPQTLKIFVAFRCETCPKRQYKCIAKFVGYVWVAFRDVVHSCSAMADWCIPEWNIGWDTPKTTDVQIERANTSQRILCGKYSKFIIHNKNNEIIYLLCLTCNLSASHIFIECLCCTYAISYAIFINEQPQSTNETIGVSRQNGLQCRRRLKNCINKT